MTRSIAEKHGLRATFMPKPFMDLTGSGCHAHVSVWRDGHNVFSDKSDEIGMSQDGYHFIGGLIHSADALAAITTPASTPTSASTRRARPPARPGRPTP